MNNNFSVISENTGAECEWEDYDISKGEICNESFTFAIVDEDDDYKTHIGHLCDSHIGPVMNILNIPESRII